MPQVCGCCFCIDCHVTLCEQPTICQGSARRFQRCCLLATVQTLKIERSLTFLLFLTCSFKYTTIKTFLQIVTVRKHHNTTHSRRFINTLSNIKQDIAGRTPVHIIVVSKTDCISDVIFYYL